MQIKTIAAEQKQHDEEGRSFATVLAAAGTGVQQSHQRQQQVKVVGLKKPVVRRAEVHKVQFTSSDKTATGRLQNSGDDLCITQNVKPSVVGFKPSKIYTLKDGKVVLETFDDYYKKLNRLNTLRNLEIKVT